MTRVRTLLALAALATALVRPGSVHAAGDFTFGVVRNVCRASGGQFGEGKLVLEVRVDERGASGANKFTFDAKVKHRGSGGTWQTEFTWDRFKVTFPDDADSYYHQRWFSYHPRHNARHEIVVVIRVWHNRHVLASKTIVGKDC